ncbi:MAG: NUDIX domain-containing protein [Candidatus Saccharimonadales bacterium]
MSEVEEILDLVNENDEVIGTIPRSEYHRIEAEKLGYIRGVELFIRNDKGQLWVPRRTLGKRIAPGGLDYSMGGHIESGESYEAAALREIKEELNLDLNEDDLEFIKKFGPGTIPYFRKLYLYKSNIVPDYNPDDYTEYYWLTPAELLARLDAGDIAKQSLRETVLALL